MSIEVITCLTQINIEAVDGKVIQRNYSAINSNVTTAQS
jgi:hypothetical protein